MKGVFSKSWNKKPHDNEGKENKGTSFFTKESKTPFFNSANSAVVQTKLTIGQPGDKYEKEADHMADAVVNKNTNTSKPDIQNREISSIQRESLATPQEDEKLGTAEQRMEEDKMVQEKPEIQKQGAEEEEELQSKPEIQKMEGEKEEELQTKKTSGSNASVASSSISQQIKSKSGKGKPLPQKTKAEMESSFGNDFSNVNIHTDQDAVTMNKELKAQAFTHGNDVYFNAGKYNPDSAKGKHLLAHELTHVVQQNKALKKKSKERDK